MNNFPGLPAADIELGQGVLRDLVSQGGSEIAIATRRRTKEYQYWRGCELDNCNRHIEQRGWIIVGPSFQPYTAIEYVEFQQGKHATPLVEYGFSSHNMMIEGQTRYNKLIEQGGIKEFPKDQLTAYGWHRYPTIRLARSDLQFDEQEYACENGCPTTGPRARIFMAADDLAQHVRAVHQEAAAPAAVGNAIAKAMQGQNNDITSVIAAVMVALKDAGVIGGKD